MHVHLPKPLHGWREFIGEVGIIVIGVSIALAAEQMIEWLHWREKTGHAREALKAELSIAYFNAAERLEVTPCLVAQLDRLQSRVLLSTDHLNPAPVLPSKFGSLTFRHPTRPWNDTIWQSVLTEQVSSHLGSSERESLSQAYRGLSQLQEANMNENEKEGALQILASPLPLDASLRAHLLETIANERWRVNYMSIVAGQVSKRILSFDGTIGRGALYAEWRRDMAGPDSTATSCRSQGLPLEVKH